MLELALEHTEELKRKLQKTWLDEKYWYYNNGSYFEQLSLKADTWNNMQYVSLNPEGEVIGYLSYGIERECWYVNYLAIINFTEDIMFGIDVLHMVKEMFEKYKFRKVDFSVIIGNPAEKKYDRLIERYGGRIVGTFKQTVKLPDGELYDEKHYEIFRTDYLHHKKKANNA